MGKIKKGILGGFSGRVGNVIGASWKGIDYMRSEASSHPDPKTAVQLANRSKFRTCVDFARQCVPIINIGLKQYAVKRSQYNYFVSKLMTDWWDNASNIINYPVVQLSNGDVPPVLITSITFVSGNCVIEFSSPQGGSDDDLLLGCSYNIVEQSMNFLPSVLHITRSSGRIVYPHSVWTEEQYVYVFCYDSDTGACSSTSCFHYVPA